MVRCRLQVCCVFLLSALTAGCGPDHKPPKGAEPVKVEPVEGTVKFPDGTPLNFGYIQFNPSGKGMGGMGRVNDKGQFKVGLGGGDKGLPAGEYKVNFLKQTSDAPPKGSNTDQIPEIYLDEEKTPLTAKVVSGNNTFNFELK